MEVQEIISIAGSALLPLVEPIIAVMVVSNILPIIPIVMQIAGKIKTKPKRRKFLAKSLTVGYTTALIFAMVGSTLFGVMGILLSDLRIAGGLILLVFAIYELLFSREERKGGLIDEESEEDEEPSIVPLAIPLMVGPATLTTVVILVESHGLGVTFISLMVNFAINGAIIAGGNVAMSKIDHGALSAVGKVFSLVLAALAVSMIRVGFLSIVG